MSDLTQRVSKLTQGNANVLKDAGDIITGDGEQTVRLINPNVGGTSDGLALVLDSTQPTGLAWAAVVAPGGISNVTGSDGVTVTTPGVGVRNATNDLVTGTPVAVIDAISLSTVDINGAGDINVAASAGGDIILSAANNIALSSVADLDVTANGALMDVANDIVLNPGGAFDVNVGLDATIDANGNISLTSDLDLSLSTTANGDINLDTNGTGDLNVTPNHDELHTVGRNFTVTASGSGGINLTSDGGDISLNSDQTDVNIRAGVVSGAGDVVINSKGAANSITLEPLLAGDVNLNTNGVGDVNVQSGGTINMDATLGVTVDTPASIALTSVGALSLTSTGGAIDLTTLNSNITATTVGTGDIVVNSNHDELHTIGRNLTVNAKGSGGASIGTEIGNLVLDAGTVDQTAETRLMPRGSAPAATLTFRIWNGAGAGQQDGNINPSGGSVVDAEVRSTVAAILDYLHGWGWVTNPSP